MSNLPISAESVELIISSEIGSKKMYDTRYNKPIWPKGDSGITIGIGYDLGYQSVSNIKKDWKHLGEATVAKLVVVQGLKGLKAKKALDDPKNGLSSIRISWQDAMLVKRPVLARFYSETLKAYPGLDKLNPNAQGAILSLTYNRGLSKKGNDSRKEMRELEGAIKSADYKKIAELLRSMKRLWADKPNAKGLVERREKEAKLIEKEFLYVTPLW